MHHRREDAGQAGEGQCILGVRLKPGARAGGCTVGKVELLPRNEVKARKRFVNSYVCVVGKSKGLARWT